MKFRQAKKIIRRELNHQVKGRISWYGNISVTGNVLGNAETRNGNIVVKGDVHGDATTRNGNII